MAARILRQCQRAGAISRSDDPAWPPAFRILAISWCAAGIRTEARQASDDNWIASFSVRGSIFQKILAYGVKEAAATLAPDLLRISSRIIKTEKHPYIRFERVGWTFVEPRERVTQIIFKLFGRPM